MYEVDHIDHSLVNAISNGNEAELRQALAEKKEFPKKFLSHCFYDCARRGNFNFAKIIYESYPSKIDVNYIHGLGNYVIHYAVIDGNKDFVNFLLDKGVNLEIVDIEGRRPLHLAFMVEKDTAEIRAAKFEIAKALFGKGADVSALDNHGRSPIRIAIQNDTPPETITPMLPRFEDLSSKPSLSVLDSAVVNGNYEIVKALIAHGAIVQTSTIDIAAKKLNVYVLQLVLEHYHLDTQDSNFFINILQNIVFCYALSPAAPVVEPVELPSLFSRMKSCIDLVVNYARQKGKDISLELKELKISLIQDSLKSDEEIHGTIYNLHMLDILNFVESFPNSENIEKPFVDSLHKTIKFIYNTISNLILQDIKNGKQKPTKESMIKILQEYKQVKIIEKSAELFKCDLENKENFGLLKASARTIKDKSIQLSKSSDYFLPKEIILYIYSYLSYEDIKNCLDAEAFFNKIDLTGQTPD